MQPTTRLTSKQEQFIINNLLNEKKIGEGAARIVFNMTAAIQHELGLDTDRYVIKVAIGEAGANQNKIEQHAYEVHGHIYPLAKISHIGKIIEIMEIFMMNAY